MDNALKTFFKVSGGTNIEEEYRNSLVEEAVTFFTENPTEYLWWARTGNMMMIALREFADDETPTNRVEFFDCNVLRQGEIYV